MKHVHLIIPSMMTLALVGCMMPMGGGFGSAQRIDPEPNGYYTGETHDFASQANPDPNGRKFRVAFLRAHFIPVDAASDVAKAKGITSADAVPTVEELKTAAGESLAAFLDKRAIVNLSESWKQISAAKPHVVTTYDSESIPRLPNGLRAILGESIWQCFRNVSILNAELASRYPNLFTTKESGFPLALAMIGFYSVENPDIKTCYEAWIIGLPDDGEWVRSLQSEEAFCDAYDASAASLFKLTSEQFKGLEPAAPGRRIWQE